MTSEDEKKGQARKRPAGPELDMKDYLALAIAGLETVLLPLLILIGILVILLLIVH